MYNFIGVKSKTKVIAPFWWSRKMETNANTHVAYNFDKLRMPR